MRDEHIVHRIADNLEGVPIRGANLGLAIALAQSQSPYARDPRETIQTWFQALVDSKTTSEEKRHKGFGYFLSQNFRNNFIGDVSEAAMPTFRHLQDLHGVPEIEKAILPWQARRWHHEKQEQMLRGWYNYLLPRREEDKGNISRQYGEIPWFIPLVLYTVSNCVMRFRDIHDTEGNVVGRKVEEDVRRSNTRDFTPEFHAGDLAIAYDLLKQQLSATQVKRYKSQKREPGGSQELIREQVNAVPNWNVNFYELYAQAKQIRALRAEQFKEGIKPNSWVPFRDADVLSAISSNTPWCFSGLDTAKYYLQPINDKPATVFVFFDGNKNPGIALHAPEVGKDKFEIRQLRGADDNEELTDPKLLAALDDFVTPQRFVNANTYKEQINDHRTLVRLEEHMSLGTEHLMSQDELRTSLRVLYELDRPIKNFGGRDADERKQRLQKVRVSLADARTIFGEVATSINDLKSGHPDAYVGPIPENEKEAKEFWELIANVEHVYTAFPEEIRRITLPGITESAHREILRDVRLKGDNPDFKGKKEYMESVEKFPLEKPVKLVFLRVADLEKFCYGPLDFNNLMAAAEKIGLKRCPLHIGPRLQSSRKLLPSFSAYLGAENVMRAPAYDEDDFPWTFTINPVRQNIGMIGAKDGNIFSRKSMFVFMIE